MSVPDNNSRVQYYAASSQTNFEYPFKIFVEQDISVYKTPAGETPDPSRDKLDYITDYTLTGLEDDNGGEVILVVGATENDIITLERSVVKNRPPEFQYTVGGEFSEQKLNENFDKLFILLQQMQDLLQNRGILYNVTDVITTGQTTLPKLGSGQVWAANTLGNLVASTIENTDVDVLRSQLASQTQTAPGSDMIGVYDTVNLQGKTLTQLVTEILTKHIFQTGFIQVTIGSDYDQYIEEGFWVIMRDGTIGNASSGATERANADTKNLFEYIWNNVSNTWCELQDSSGVPTPRGASATADFNANRRMPLPKALGRAIISAGHGSGLTDRELCSYFGAETHALNSSENGAHTHQLTSGSGYTERGAADTQLQLRQDTGGELGTFTQTTGSSGLGTPHNNMQPSLALTFLIKL